ncbi:FxDxF family PEP-CTERM protein [Duganella callida]|uniref:PEP-CTERM sorting domain-containing protein n=1 Tax=Duganella callida TaxID=2561932 RepID=A0A4Y9S7H2_9BURK|nr:FxDxF family PEP-CTERM protein [Duganella callida]TFW15987.1 PEP-CTERM sorting domain-containing protein [Duganella callida]
MLKRLAVASLMLCAASGAMADDQVWNAGAIPASPGLYFVTVHHALGDFADIVNFSVGDGNLGVSAAALSVPSPFDNGYLSTISSLNYSIWLDGTQIASSTNGAAFTKSLTAGSYELHVSGTAESWAGIGGTYGLGLSVSPVPEPVTVGMLIAGLGILGMARRRDDAANDKFS